MCAIEEVIERAVSRGTRDGPTMTQFDPFESDRGPGGDPAPVPEAAMTRRDGRRRKLTRLPAVREIAV